MKKIGSIPLPAITLFLGIILIVHVAIRHPPTFSFLPPDLLAGILFLYSPIFHYRRAKAPGWLTLGDAGKSLRVFLALSFAGTLAYLAYSRLPLPPALTPFIGGIPRPAELLFREGLLVALPEEVFFRGYIYDSFEEKGWEPVFPSALLFAMGHLLIFASWYRSLTILPGLLLGWSRKSTGNIYVPILLHLAFNLLPYAIWGPG